ncbi:MAG: hypothetical protein ACXWJZ_15760 [Burkholderiaceae bacterium]
MSEQKSRKLDGSDRRKTFVLLFAIWLVSVAASISVHRDTIPVLQFSDPDDSMRLVQVRDFLAGQSWFDVSQHRANPPTGGPMHWSRLVDLPIAGFILLLRPFLGEHWSEVGAVLIVPALTLAMLLSSLYWAVRPLLGQGTALLACAAFAITPFIFLQCAAMRIDHHAWQAVMMALALGGALHADGRKGGLVAGAAMAIWMQISIEGLALTAVTGAVMTLRYTVSDKEWARVAYYFWTLVIASIGLVLLMHGWKGALVSSCDSISPVYLAPLAAIPPSMAMFHRLLGQTSPPARFLSIVLPGGLASAIFLAAGKQCIAGPFDTLDPLVYELWYKAVPEGLPLWVHDVDTVIVVLFPALIGIAAYVTAFLKEKSAMRRLDWLSLLVFAVGATILSILLMRAGFVAHLLCIPGAAWLFDVLFRRARKVSASMLRIPATLMTLTLLFPVVVVPLKSAALPNSGINHTLDDEAFGMIEIEEFEALSRISPAVIFAPIDISPEILLRTNNSIIGTGHHRNVRGIELVMHAFVSPPDQAHQIVMSSAATFLLIVPSGEVFRYLRHNRNGLAGQLLRGKVPDWLSPVTLPGLKYLRLYRINRDVPKRPTETASPVM